MGDICYVISRPGSKSGGRTAIYAITCDIGGATLRPGNIQGISSGDDRNYDAGYFFWGDGILRRAALFIRSRAKVGDLIIGPNTIVISDSIGEPRIQVRIRSNISNVISGSGRKAGGGAPINPIACDVRGSTRVPRDR